MNWVLVSLETTTEKLVKGKDETPLTSPKFHDLTEAAQAQVKTVMAAARGLAKAMYPGENIMVYASGFAWPAGERLPVGDMPFVALNVSRREG